MIRRPPRYTLRHSSAASDVYKRQDRDRERHTESERQRETHTQSKTEKDRQTDRRSTWCRNPYCLIFNGFPFTQNGSVLLCLAAVHCQCALWVAQRLDHGTASASLTPKSLNAFQIISHTCISPLKEMAVPETCSRQNRLT